VYIFEIKRISIHCPFGKHNYSDSKHFEYTCSAKECYQHIDICMYCQCNESRLRWNESRRIDREIDQEAKD
jgi:hypothetical protein